MEANLQTRSARGMQLTGELRRVSPLALPKFKPQPLAGSKPEFEWVEPQALLVDGAYQRSPSGRTLALVQRIAAAWDWSRFKPPIVARTPEGLEVIDGQHTAIAASMRPEIERIPVMVVAARAQNDRAASFIGHNRDRVAITPTQIHFAALLAGDEDAQTLQQVCDRAGVKILRVPPGNQEYQPGETVAVLAAMNLIDRRGAAGARRVLEVLVAAARAPISAAEIRAVELLMYDDEFRKEISADDIVCTFDTICDTLENECKLFAATHKIPNWRAMAMVLFRRRRKRRSPTVTNGVDKGIRQLAN